MDVGVPGRRIVEAIPEGDEANNGLMTSFPSAVASGLSLKEDS
jgi:hypothetical protein